ncbi:hypothetical protein Pan241w_11190 [Gimesia alba]|uniref:Uncharacterized protein n=1 Tax=Gimesia alba TaxID=2527973 RepID=A0A517RAZ7_9PLAN|nr:hypothetical protein Pan241w_11190 [Gimesia alba]
MLYPQFAHRDCSHCLKWAYNDKPGAERYGEIEEFKGEPQRRHPKHLPLCQTKDGCPKGTPGGQNSLSDKNRQAYRHFRECKAVGQFPDDPIVRMNADLIQSVLDRVTEKQRVDELTLLTSIITR